MINLQDPQIPPPIKAVEIDAAIYELQVALDANLNWLSHNYARAYRYIEKNGSKLYFPEIYVGGAKKAYYRVTPDNDKSGVCFFVVAREEVVDYMANNKNLLRYKVGVVFQVNLGLINSSLLENEKFTQNLVRDARRVLTNSSTKSSSLRILNVEREFNKIYKEFRISEKEGYMRSPHDAFRINLELVMGEDCGVVTFNPKQALINNLSDAEKVVILQSLDFSNTLFSNALTTQQRADLGI